MSSAELTEPGKQLCSSVLPWVWMQFIQGSTRFGRLSAVWTDEEEYLRADPGHAEGTMSTGWLGNTW